MSSTIQIRVDDELKMKSDQLFKDLGTDTTTAIRMFLTQAVANNGFPFEIKRIVRSPYSPMTEEEILEKLEKSRESAAKGNHKSAEVVVSELRGKYFFNIFSLKRKMNQQPEIFLTILEIH